MQLLLPEQRRLTGQDLLELYAGRDTEPVVRAGFVLTTDGGAAWDGGSRALQTPADQAVFHALRAVADAVVVGAGTARAENYGPVRPQPTGAAWRASHGRPDAPALVLISRSLDLDPAHRAFSGPTRTVVVTCARARPSTALRAVADLIVAGQDEVDLPAAVQALRDRGLTQLLCEGGPRLVTDLLSAGLVQELCLTSTPLLIGTAPTLLTRALTHPVRLRLAHLIDGGDGALLARYLLT